eukprot:scaffold7908_cov46-Attheya_sp.AAC.1
MTITRLPLLESPDNCVDVARGVDEVMEAEGESVSNVEGIEVEGYREGLFGCCCRCSSEMATAISAPTLALFRTKAMLLRKLAPWVNSATRFSKKGVTSRPAVTMVACSDADAHSRKAV